MSDSIIVNLHIGYYFTANGQGVIKHMRNEVLSTSQEEIVLLNYIFTRR